MTYTCGACVYFRKITGSPSGECFLNPPHTFHGGFHSRPVVGIHDRQCSYFLAADNPATLTPEKLKQAAKQIIANALKAGTLRPSTSPEDVAAPRGKRRA